MNEVQRWEPYESRGSRTVLGERRGAIPCATHLPLYRQSGIYARECVDLDRSTLATWVGEASSLLEPLVAALRRYVLAASKVHGDDTPVPVLAPGQGKTKTGGCGPMFAMIARRPARKLRQCGLLTRRIAAVNIRSNI